MNASPTICLNGQFLNAREASLPVADRGFRFGDGVFETIRLVAGVPYQWALHLHRLEAGLAALRIAPPAVDWASIARELIERNAANEGFLRLAISRGVGSRGYLPEANITPNWVMEYLPPAPLPAQPFTLWCGHATRAPLSALPSNCKLAHGIGSTLALLEARDHGAEEALLLTPEGNLCEAASGNLFWLKGGNLVTPALSTACLAGTTRAAVLRLAPLPVAEVVVPLASLEGAKAVFLSNTRLGVWPVAELLPMGWRFEAAHPLIQEITRRLEADRAAASWGDT